MYIFPCCLKLWSLDSTIDKCATAAKIPLPRPNIVEDCYDGLRPLAESSLSESPIRCFTRLTLHKEDMHNMRLRDDFRHKQVAQAVADGPNQRIAAIYYCLRGPQQRTTTLDFEGMQESGLVMQSSALRVSL